MFYRNISNTAIIYHGLLTFVAVTILKQERKVMIFIDMIYNFYRDIVREDEIPKNMVAESEEKRQELVECLSNTDEILGEMFLGKKQFC